MKCPGRGAKNTKLNPSPKIHSKITQHLWDNLNACLLEFFGPMDMDKSKKLLVTKFQKAFTKKKRKQMSVV